MPLPTPTLPELLAQVKADVRFETGNVPPRRSIEYALAYAVALQSKGQHRALAKAFRQCFPTSADEERFWEWASLYIDRTPATPWQGIVRFTGVDTTVIPALSTIVRDDGYTYQTDAAAAIGSVVSGYVDVACTATATYYGAAGNNDDSDPLQVSPSITDVDAECTVQSTANSGEDIESAEDGLVRLLVRLRTPPSGGGPGDYEAWALEVAGVTRAWQFANLYGPNTVGIAFVRDNDGTGSAIIPDAAERTEVEDHLATVAPVTVGVTAIVLTANTVDIEITNLSPDTAAVRAAIQTSLEDFFVREAAPGGTLELSRISAAISNAVGEVSHELTDPVAPVVSTSAQMPILGTITYV